MDKEAKKLIKQLSLTPHPEGGYFRETYRSNDLVISPKNKQKRNSLTDIYFLLLSGQISRLHRVTHDEIWHFYQGDPLELLEINPNNFKLTKIILGNKKINQYKYCIKGGYWQAAITTGKYSLVGCTVAPGFDFSDFSFLKDNCQLTNEILKKYHQLAKFI